MFKQLFTERSQLDKMKSKLTSLEYDLKDLKKVGDKKKIANLEKMKANLEIAISNLNEAKTITFKKEGPNGHFFLKSVEVPEKDAKKIIKANSDNRGGWYTFKVNGDTVIVGNNLWSDLGLDEY